MKTVRGCFNIVPFLIVVFASSIGLYASSSSDIEQEHNLMPVPKEAFFSQGKLRFTSDFRVDLIGHTEPRLERALDRFRQRLCTETGIPLIALGVDAHSKVDFVVHSASSGEPVQSIRTDESYTLQVTSNQARLEARTPIGVLRGLETFLQLLSIDSEGFYVPAVRIIDEPRFAWRGLLIDVCRHWLPMEVIKRNLDGMASVKMNVLHWHLSEDQGFRVECKAFPKLHQLGSDGQFYTHDQVRDVVEYARDRGIRVVPEFDMPAHTTSWFVGYPDLASVPGPYDIARDWGVHHPCLNPTREETYAFLDAFLGEMVDLFPDAHFHIGGDEVSGKHWDVNPQIVTFKREKGMKDNHDLQAYFTRRVQKILNKYEKTMIGWDEVFHPDLPKNVIVQSWRGPTYIAESVRSGHEGIRSNGYYIDLFHSAETHYKVDPLPLGGASLTLEQKERILGGEACMWAELVNEEIVDSRIWPRLAGVAERLWSPSDVQDIEDMYRRLAVIDRKLVWLGLTHRTNSEKMLVRLTGGNSVSDLKILAEIVEPVKFYKRHRSRKYTQMTPLNRLVDAVRPESWTARQFSLDVDEILTESLDSAINKEICRAWLIQWRDNHTKLKAILNSSFLLQEIIPLSERISSLAEAGLSALEYLERGEAAPQKWVDQVSNLFLQPKKPAHELLIAIIPAIQRLVEAASSKPPTSQR
ncbi:beta-N-acetylhexosaminidase [Acidobacteriota bacterium]